VVIEAGVVVGYIIAWVVRKARRVGGRLDAEVDNALDVGLDQLHTLVADRLGADPALTELHDEAGSDGQVSELTRQRVELSLLAAAAKDQTFAAEVTALAEQLQATERSMGTVAIGPEATAVTGDINITADRASAAAFRMSDVHVGLSVPTDPQQPGRSSG
jgi:hypothetical protein